MDLNDYLDIKLQNFYAEFEMYNNLTARDGKVSLRFKNRIIQAQLLTPITKGLIKVIKSGDKYFVAQQAQNRDITVYTKVRQEKKVYKNKEDEEIISYIIFVLCDKERTDVEQKSVVPVERLANIQIVEDIIVIDKSKRFSKIKLEDLRLDKDPTKVKDPYLSFFSFLQNVSGLNVIKSSKYTSFYNFLVNSKVKKEQQTISNFELDDEEYSKAKLKLFGYSFLFENAAIYQNFNIRTAIRRSNKVKPYTYVNHNGERPNKEVRYVQPLLKFYSKLSDGVPDNSLDKTHFIPKIKNLGILNKVFPELEDYEYPMAVEVLTRIDLARQITYIQVAHPQIVYEPVTILNYESVLVGFKGILRFLSEGCYLQEIGDTSVKILSINPTTKIIRVVGVSNSKIGGDIKIENIGGLTVNSIGIITGKKGKSIFLKY